MNKINTVTIKNPTLMLWRQYIMFDLLVIIVFEKLRGNCCTKMRVSLLYLSKLLRNLSFKRVKQKTVE